MSNSAMDVDWMKCQALFLENSKKKKNNRFFYLLKSPFAWQDWKWYEKEGISQVAILSYHGSFTRKHLKHTPLHMTCFSLCFGAVSQGFSFLTLWIPRAAWLLHMVVKLLSSLCVLLVDLCSFLRDFLIWRGS